MTNLNLSPLDKLRVADPDTYVWVRGRVVLLDAIPDEAALTLLAEETIWGLALEPGLGEAMAKGLLRLMAQSSPSTIMAYVAHVHRAAKTGATLGRIEAIFWVPVLLAGEQLVPLFETTLATMLAKGTYTLNTPLEVMAELLSSEEPDAAKSYLELLCATFCQEISYNQSLRLAYLLPKAVRAFAPQRRKAQIEQLTRVVKIDLRLVDPFVDGLEKGSGLLDAQALEKFIDRALKRYAKDAGAGIKFLGLASQVGQDACAALQTAIPLSQVIVQISRYLQARIGCPVAVKPVTDLVAREMDVPWTASDGRCIYLPAEIVWFQDPHQNRSLFKALTRLEAGYFECRTFDFDLERAADRYPEVAQWLLSVPAHDPDSPACDGERFLRGFVQSRLAADLFTLYEQARIAIRMDRRYPGMMRQVMPLLQDNARHMQQQGWAHFLAPVYTKLVLDMELPYSDQAAQAELQRELVDLFIRQIDGQSAVEAIAELVVLAYGAIVRLLGSMPHNYKILDLPFDRHIHWDLVSTAYAFEERLAARVKMRLAEKNLSVYRSDLRNRLADQQGQLSADDVGQLVFDRAGVSGRAEVQLDGIELDLTDLANIEGLDVQAHGHNNDGAFRYPEWDSHLQDYLHEHVRVQEIEVSAEHDSQFYQNTLDRHLGIVTCMRRAFELLKPEGLTILRQWPEGDAFDYRALIDFAIDRRAGRMPSDRLFIKRLKQERDVAVLLLIDLSRSTANPVAGRHTTVLGVAKEALVLFCEALQVVGDTYAIAGFSGTGRLSVDYFRIKDFQVPLSESVRAQISALAPQRSTRMGAAIRHGTAQLAQIESRVRLMIVVSDGFPNDLGYKADYAIADTRRAIQEARARGFHLKAITVNIGSDPRLDELYGRFHHHVIGDVRELPDKLLRLYGTLTRV